MARLNYFAVAIVCLSVGRAAVSADAIWPRFRGPNGNGVRMYVRTSGSGLETIAVWKQLDIRANEIHTGK